MSSAVCLPRTGAAICATLPDRSVNEGRRVGKGTGRSPVTCPPSQAVHGMVGTARRRAFAHPTGCGKRGSLRPAQQVAVAAVGGGGEAEAAEEAQRRAFLLDLGRQ